MWEGVSPEGHLAARTALALSVAVNLLCDMGLMCLSLEYIAQTPVSQTAVLQEGEAGNKTKDTNGTKEPGPLPPTCQAHTQLEAQVEILVRLWTVSSFENRV